MPTLPAPATPSTSSADPTATTAAGGPGGVASTDPLAGRPFEVHVPPSYDPEAPMPLVVLLHGYSSNGDMQEAYFQLDVLADERGFLTVHPDGTFDRRRLRFWNATDACCNLDDLAVDDVDYLTALIDDVSDRFAVDPQRIHLVGHSNGGFMSHRMACDRAGLIASIASLAGATFADDADCTPSEPVSVVQIHGTLDSVIAFGGGNVFGQSAAYPGAARTTELWAGDVGCDPASTERGEPLDLEGALPGAETSVTRYEGCPPGIDVELWAIEGGSHIPYLSGSFMGTVVDFLLAHPKPD